MGHVVVLLHTDMTANMLKQDEKQLLAPLITPRVLPVHQDRIYELWLDNEKLVDDWLRQQERDGKLWRVHQHMDYQSAKKEESGEYLCLSVAFRAEK